jgi:hypothetical protein
MANLSCTNKAHVATGHVVIVQMARRSGRNWRQPVMFKHRKQDLTYFQLEVLQLFLRAWGGVVVKALLVRRSLDRSPAVSLGIFSEASDKSMCPGLTQPLRNEYQDIPGVKAASA